MRFWRNNLIAILALAILASMAVQAYVGEHGLHAHSSQQSRISGLSKQLHILKARRQQLEARVRLLSPDQIDRDLLEEVARRQLNFVYENDTVYIRDGQ